MKERNSPPTFKGYDISPDMVRLSLVNLYLHGFTSPQVEEYDTLTSQDKWNEVADVILANPPFMSPKGGIKPHDRFGVKSKRSEVLFVDYMAEHLTPTGRAGIIVPEGIIFQSQTAYVSLRKMLVEKYLVAVVSLPAGIFQPYSGVKTSILIFDKSLAKNADTVGFFKVESDGFGSGAQRRAVEKNDLPQVQAEIAEYLKRLRNRESLTPSPGTPGEGRGGGFSPAFGLIVPKEKIVGNGDYNLSGERYRDSITGATQYPLVALGELAELVRGITFGKGDQLEVPTTDSLRVVTTKAAQLSGIVEADMYHIPKGHLKDESKLLRKGDILISTANSLHLLGRTTHVHRAEHPMSFGAFMSVIRPNDRVLDAYLIRCLRTKYAHAFFLQNANTTTNISNLNLSTLANFEIPLPPLSVQKEIVAEIEGYQKVIDGARAVLDHYRPHIPIQPDWPMVRLENICDIQRGKFTHRPRNEPRFYGGDYPFIQTGDVVRASNGGKVTYTQTLNEDGLAVSRLFQPPIVLITIAANIGDTAVLDFPCCFPDSVVGLIPKPEVDVHFLEIVMRTQKQRLNDLAPQAAQKNINNEILKEVEIPLPPLPVQQQIVAEIEAEQRLVAGNRELIERFEKKIQQTLARVWGEEAKPPAAPVPEPELVAIDGND